MIVGLSQTVCQQIQEIDSLERLKNDLSSIQATFDSLTRLKESVVQLRALITIFEDRLGQQAIQNTKRGMGRLIRDVQISAENFGSQPRQVKELTLLQGRTQELIKDIKAQWRLYAEENTRETFELLSLVSYLPEVEADQKNYQRLRARLRHYTEQTPLTPEQLAEFDRSLQQLNEHLGNIRGLSPAVKQFLENVLKDKATLADLTDEVLQWCRQGGHAQAFIIGFTRNKRG